MTTDAERRTDWHLDGLFSSADARGRKRGKVYRLPRSQGLKGKCTDFAESFFFLSTD